MYRERRSSVAGAVAWTATGTSAAPADSGTDGAAGLVLPDGCMDLLWIDDRLVIAGPDSVATPSGVAATEAVHGLRFASGRLPAWLGVPAHAVRDQRVPLDEVWDRERVEPFAERVAAAADPTAALEAVAHESLVGTEPVEPVVLAVAAELAAGRPVATVADRVGYSARQLHRRSLDAFGYGPKVLLRVLRLQRALALARSGRAFAAVALDAGYADQAHLARDVHALTGRTLTQLTR